MNTVYLNLNGIFLKDLAHNNTVQGNLAYDNTCGINITNVNGTIVEWNEVFDNDEVGIGLTGAGNATILWNRIERNLAEGILLLNSHENVISNNSVLNYSIYGIRLSASNYNNVTWNEIHGNVSLECIHEDIGSHDNIIIPNNCDPIGPNLLPISPSTSTTGIIVLGWTVESWHETFWVYRSIIPITNIADLEPIAELTVNSFTDTVTISGGYYYAIMASNESVNTTISNVQYVLIDLEGTNPGGGIPGFEFWPVVLASIIGIGIIMLSRVKRGKSHPRDC
jgi:parallel beta-helix repeat protein